MPPEPERCRVVALGASAGGLDAFGRFFRSVEPGAGLAFVVVQHLSPEHESILPQLLAAFTKIPVAAVADDEASVLSADLMIGVTQFFRDDGAFQALGETVLPELLEFSGDQPVRVWVPGCATGEEAYSLAIQLLSHARRLKGAGGPAPRVQVFATDINEVSLATARLGRYPAAIEADVPREWLGRHFIAEDGGYVVSKEVRDCCIFSMHDVLRDPPFSRVDLVSCRNLLIYFDSDVQARLFPVFHYALRPSGFLFLGSSETVGDASSLFEVIDKKHRLFRRSNEAEARVRLPLLVSGVEKRVPRPPQRTGSDAGMVELLRSVVTGLLEEERAAVALVDARGNARNFAGPVSRYLPTPAGSPTTNVLELASGDFRLELSAALQAAGAGGGRIRRELATGAGGTQRIELAVRSLPVPGLPPDQFLVSFRDLEATPGALQDGDERAHELEGELRVATDRWRRAVQDLESANEELRPGSGSWSVPTEVGGTCCAPCRTGPSRG